ncbi:hypothetical protein [Neisseria sp. Ec49-e6-T10]|uniref:hypothetical protein n=1 Tax=Neisseria sp. Ec49-e6-T10 TaxID=3140744 RepID=UPI003EBE89AF
MNSLNKNFLGLIVTCLFFVSACDQKETPKQENQVSSSTVIGDQGNVVVSEPTGVEQQQNTIGSKQPANLSSALQQLQLEVDKIKAENKFPLKLANDLSLDSVDFYVSQTPIIKYEYTYLNVLSSNVQNIEKVKAQKIDIARQLLKNMCANPQSDILKKEGVLLEYRYKTKDQKELIHFLLDLNKSCPKGK